MSQLFQQLSPRLIDNLQVFLVTSCVIHTDLVRNKSGCLPTPYYGLYTQECCKLMPINTTKKHPDHTDSISSRAIR
ncbi:hypothetical protein GWI33_017727 [Rhynchophorus ferrugineus]|uniref:Uncharacterized protein n=1 Tax=Rhynchophorus ferrugineus TaxID=354439 RepID=A0A834HZ84_RHYFE|nr:hypothetical protein GWI33_017727 [Rhynchophorus ferrugineus]